MIGKRSPQKDLFDVGNVFPLELPRTTFYGQLAAAAARLFRDDDFAAFYCERMGRPSVPPAQLALMTLLQHHDGCSDEEAVARSAYDLRWAAVLGKAAGEPLCAKSTFQLFRAHLILHDEVRGVFQGSIAEAKRTGLLQKGTALRAAIDTKPVLGRGAVKDTYNLLGDGIKQLVRGLAADAGQKAEEWTKAHDFGGYFGSSVKGEAEIDWSDEQARKGFLSKIVADARRLLLLAAERLGAGGGEQIGEAGKLLEALLLQDVVEESDGEGGAKAEIKKGTTPGRIASLTDQEQKHGHKSKSKQFTGHKAATVVDVESGIILEADVLPGNAGDAQGALEQIERAEENAQEKIEQATGDCAYGGGDTRQAFADAGRDFMAKVPQEGTNKGLFPKSAFTIDFEHNTVSCPGGKTVVDFHREKNGGKVFCFGVLCQGCPLREQCTRAVQGRTIRMHPQEAMRQAARAHQETPEGRARLQRRVAVEHALARLAHLGIGQARYFGRAKTRFQLLMAATVANLRRAWNWEQARGSADKTGPGGSGNEAKGQTEGALAAFGAAFRRLRSLGWRSLHPWPIRMRWSAAATPGR